MLQFLGLSSLSYTSDLSDDMRADLISKFNDSTVRVNVGIFSLSFNVSGLNLQMACSHGVCLSFYFNPSTMLQAFARIHRIGQLIVVFWWIFKQVGGYHEVQERIIHQKQASFYSVQASIPKEITGELREIVCFELARQSWGTMESKYVVAKYKNDLKHMASWSELWIKRFVPSICLLFLVISIGIRGLIC